MGSSTRHTTPTTVHVLDDYQGVAEHYADWSAGPHDLSVQFFRDHLRDLEALRARHADAEVLVVMRERTPLPAAFFDGLPKLRLIVTTGARNASIDLKAAARAGITVCGTRALTTPPAELTWGLILAALRDIPGQQDRLRRGAWQGPVGTGLAGRCLGVLGLGRIGRHVTEIARAFQMDVLAWSENLTDEQATAAGARRAEKDELFTEADIVTIHLRLSDRTRGLIGQAELAAMGPNAWLINTSRAEIVQHEPLLRVLREGAIAGLATDVYTTEPLPPDDPLLQAPHTLLTPHLGYVVDENYERYYRDAHEDIMGFLSGLPVRVISPATP